MVYIFGLSGECVGIKPVKQGYIHSQSNLGILRSVNVSINEAWTQKLKFRKTHLCGRLRVETLLRQPAGIIITYANNL